MTPPETEACHHHYALGEIDALVKKAVRGAGFDWGQAEEAGKSVRWLAASPLPSVQAISAYLQARESEPSRFVAPSASMAASSVLCPLLSAEHLMDSAQSGHETLSTSWQFSSLAWPVLLWPAAVWVGRQFGLSLTARFDGVQLHNHHDHLSVQCADPSALLLPVATEFRLQYQLATRPLLASPDAVFGQRVAVSSAHWAVLEAFAKRTYVPATEASRERAGPAN